MADETTTITQQPETTHPEDNGGSTGKTFTQDEVNRIVSDRLARERAKADTDPTQEREKAIAARESALGCREYIQEAGYPAILLELFDTGDADKFKANIGKLIEALPTIKPGAAVPHVVAATRGSASTDAIAQAFKPKI